MSQSKSENGTTNSISPPIPPLLPPPPEYIPPTTSFTTITSASISMLGTTTNALTKCIATSQIDLPEAATVAEEATINTNNYNNHNNNNNNNQSILNIVTDNENDIINLTSPSTVDADQNGDGTDVDVVMGERSVIGGKIETTI